MRGVRNRLLTLALHRTQSLCNQRFHLPCIAMHRRCFLAWVITGLPPAFALELNQASEAELDGLRGIGPPFTRRLLAARAVQGFKNWDDAMQRVSGMGPRIAQRLSEQGLRVNGQAYVPVRRLTD